MATSDSELIAELRVQTGYSSRTLSDPDFESVIDTARRHITTRLTIGSNWTDSEWYDEPAREEALFWTTALFALAATGELDRNDIQVGGIDTKALLANDDGDITEWYRNSEQAIRALSADPDTGTSYGITSVTREDQEDTNERPTRDDGGV